jgi:hypothetical protein
VQRGRRFVLGKPVERGAQVVLVQGQPADDLLGDPVVGDGG